MKRWMLLVLATLASCDRQGDVPRASSARASVGPEVTPATRAIVGSRVTWRGVAANHKVGAFLDGPGIYVDLPGTHWPIDVVDRTVEVEGTIAGRRDLPVFIERGPDEPQVQGIPMPPGTDLDKASRRSILENVRWRPVGEEAWR